MRKLLLALLLAIAAPAYAATTCVTGTAGAAPTAAISFVAPTVNTDGTPVATPLTYNLWQGTTSGGEAKVASGLTGSPITVNTGLADGSSYYFYVTVTDAKGSTSSPSNEVCKAFAVGTPTTITITIAWNAPTKNIDGSKANPPFSYILWREPAPGADAQTLVKFVNGTSTTVSATVGKQACYWLLAVDSRGIASPPSAQVCKTPSA